ncbi:MAG TPA: hypothetical protein VH307_23230 [Streptosporangiaceae bacterium]|nr:hypothetical protein [Streptosporangiaceae bacterium]
MIFLLHWIARRANKATIISAPAGSGKTSLLRAWADRPGRPHRPAEPGPNPGLLPLQRQRSPGERQPNEDQVHLQRPARGQELANLDEAEAEAERLGLGQHTPSADPPVAC